MSTQPSVASTLPSIAAPSSTPSQNSTSSPTSQSHSTSPPNTSAPQQQSPETARQVREARTYLLASLSSITAPLDRDLRQRAQNLHANSGALSKQEDDLQRATLGLKKENDKLVTELAVGQRKVKELGNVQNWAEMLERDFLVLEETLRLVDRGDSGNEDSWSSGSSEWADGSVRMDGFMEQEEELESRRRDGTSWEQPLLEETAPELVDPLFSKSNTPGIGTSGFGTPMEVDIASDGDIAMSGTKEIDCIDKGKGRVVEDISMGDNEKIGPVSSADQTNSLHELLRGVDNHDQAGYEKSFPMAPFREELGNVEQPDTEETLHDDL